MINKVNFEINDGDLFLKFPHVEPIMIITSISEDGTVDAAVKTWPARVENPRFGA